MKISIFQQFSDVLFKFLKKFILDKKKHNRDRNKKILPTYLADFLAVESFQFHSNYNNKKMHY